MELSKQVKRQYFTKKVKKKSHIIFSHRLWLLPGTELAALHYLTGYGSRKTSFSLKTRFETLSGNGNNAVVCEGFCSLEFL